MRQTLLRIPWDGLTIGGVTIPIFGIGLLLLAWVVFGLIQAAWIWSERKGKPTADDALSLGIWGAIATAIVLLPRFGPGFAPQGVPIFGYGFMLFIAFITSGWLATRRAKDIGLPEELIWDCAVWLFLAGVTGCRLFYCIQHYDRVFGDRTGLDWLFALVNLSNGGLVLYGGIITGAIAYFVFCYKKKLSPLLMADVIAPSLMLGIGFGRIGCFLNGCCYGDRCDLPWGISFPSGSVPFDALAESGFVDPLSAATFPLHPTQLYSAIDGFLLCGLTTLYFPYRRQNGEILAIVWLIYPVTRFLIEFLRGDELGQFGTTFTISQWVSLLLFSAAIPYCIYLIRRRAALNPINVY